MILTNNNSLLFYNHLQAEFFFQIHFFKEKSFPLRHSNCLELSIQEHILYEGFLTPSVIFFKNEDCHVSTI